MTPRTLLPLIRIIDDDEALLASSALLLRAMGWEVETWSDGASFLKAENLLRPGCIILDVQMPGMDGLEVQAELMRRGSRIPVLFFDRSRLHSTCGPGASPGGRGFPREARRPHDACRKSRSVRDRFGCKIRGGIGPEGNAGAL